MLLVKLRWQNLQSRLSSQFRGADRPFLSVLFVHLKSTRGLSL
jgi:hypothetical protein